MFEDGRSITNLSKIAHIYTDEKEKKKQQTKSCIIDPFLYLFD